MEKILHVNDYPADSSGGAEVVMSRTIALTQRRGLTVQAFSVADLADGRRTPWRYLDNAHARQALSARLVRFRPHVVHLHNFNHVLSPGILAELADYKEQRPLRVVMTAHDYHLVSPNSGGSSFGWVSGKREVILPQHLAGLGYRLTRAWDHRSSLHSLLKLLQHEWHYRWKNRQRVIDRVICPSRFVQQMLGRSGLKTSWLPHPVPPLLRNAAPRSGPLRLVYAGRIEPEKGLYEFLRAWPADFAAQLTVIGEGTQLARCRQLCAGRAWEERVQFLGHKPHAQTLERIAEAHVLVQPSRVLETYGLTLIEALAAGTNVLASDRGASREIVEDAGVGYLYAVENDASLVEQLRVIQRRFAEGTLNRFQIAAFLSQRSESEYIDGLLRLYENEAEETDEIPTRARNDSAAA